MVRPGLADPCVGMMLPSQINRFGDVVRAAEFVDDRGAWVGAHAGGPDQMSVTGFLDDLLCAGSLHDLHGLFFAALDELLDHCHGD